MEKVIGFPKNINLESVLRNFLCKKKKIDFWGKLMYVLKTLVYDIFFKKFMEKEKKKVNFFDNFLYLS